MDDDGGGGGGCDGGNGDGEGDDDDDVHLYHSVETSALHVRTSAVLLPYFRTSIF